MCAVEWVRGELVEESTERSSTSAAASLISIAVGAPMPDGVGEPFLDCPEEQFGLGWLDMV